MTQKLRSLSRETQGGVMVEFAFILPIMLMLTFPVIDYSRYILIQQKTVKAAAFMADAVSMSAPITPVTTQQNVDENGLLLTENVLREVVDTMNTHMIPFPAQPAGGNPLYQVVITNVYRAANGAPSLGWQYDLQSHSLYSAARQSDIGVVAGIGNIGSPAAVTPELSTLDVGENMIVAEVSAQYAPITPNLSALGIGFLQAQTIRYRAFYRARYGNLRCIWQVYMPPNGC